MGWDTEMLGDNLSDFSIGVPDLLEMIARLDEPAQENMLRMTHSYLAMAHYGFTEREEAKYSWPFLQEETTKIDITSPYRYIELWGPKHDV